MEKKQTSSHIARKKSKKDPCPVCNENLHLDMYVTQRIGLLAEDDYTVEGWMCPHCRAQFDLKDNLVHINPSNMYMGRA